MDLISIKKSKIEVIDSLSLSADAHYQRWANKDDEYNPNLAIHHLELAADQGHPAAQYHLGCLYMTGGEIEKDVDQGVKLLKQAAIRRNLPACFAVGCMYFRGKYAIKNDTIALKFLAPIAGYGNIKAQALAAPLYFKGGNTFKGLSYLLNVIQSHDRGTWEKIGAVLQEGDEIDRKFGSIYLELADGRRASPLFLLSLDQDQFLSPFLVKIYDPGYDNEENEKIIDLGS